MGMWLYLVDTSIESYQSWECGRCLVDTSIESYQSWECGRFLADTSIESYKSESEHNKVKNFEFF